MPRLMTGLLASLVPLTADAHVSEQGLVLLLPVKTWTAAGIAAVVLTILLLAFLPLRNTTLPPSPPTHWASHTRTPLNIILSLVSLGVLVLLIIIGFTGSRDPLDNLLPLVIWTLWWMGFVVLQGLLGNLWRWINPWTGLYALVTARTRTPKTLPAGLGAWPGVLVFVVFSAFVFAHPAPDDPARLAVVVVVYWLITFAGILVFGPESWLGRVECFSMFLEYVARLAPVWRDGNSWLIRPPGWQLKRSAPVSFSVGIFLLVLLGCGSFDGLNETFWWLTQIGVNPLEFPGRSAIIAPTIFGLIGANLLLIIVFGVCVATGMLMIDGGFEPGAPVSFATAFGLLAVSTLPIAFAYHIAHYLTAFIVNVQYAASALTDPMASGADFLGLGQFYVTTGFFNSTDTVRLIWLTQAGAVVIGHMVAVVVGHTAALHLFGHHRRAVISQIPLACFMVLYTFLGLWLLASPRGA